MVLALPFALPLAIYAIRSAPHRPFAATALCLWNAFLTLLWLGQQLVCGPVRASAGLRFALLLVTTALLFLFGRRFRALCEGRCQPHRATACLFILQLLWFALMTVNWPDPPSLFASLSAIGLGVTLFSHSPTPPQGAPLPF